MAAGITGRADVIGTVPTIVAREIIKYTQPNLEFGNRVNTTFAQGINVGDRVQIPTYNDTATSPDSGSLATTQLPTGASPFSGGAELNSGGLTYSDQAIGSATVYISSWWYVGIELSAYAQATAQGDLTALFRQAGVDALSTRIDTDIATLITGLSQTKGALGTGLSDPVIRDAINVLDTGNVPGDGRSFVFSPDEKANLLGVDKYTNSLYTGSTQAVTRGVLGSFYGMDWAMTTQVPAPAAGQHRNVIFHRDTWALVMRQPVRVVGFDSPDSSLFSTRILATAIWGVAEVRDRFGVQALGV